MKIECQQKNILKIRDGIPGHGLQIALFCYRVLGIGRIKLACGCNLPISWLPTQEAIGISDIPRLVSWRKQ